MSVLSIGGGLFNQDSNTGSYHSTGDSELPFLPVAPPREFDPSPEKPLGSTR